MRAPVTLTECVTQSVGLKVLLVLPAPLNDPARTSPERELATIFGVFDELRVEATLIRLNPPTAEALTTAISLNSFDVIHIAGHGAVDHLELETDAGLLAAVSYYEFARMLAEHRRCVIVLTGCATEAFADVAASAVGQITTIAVSGDMPRHDGQRALAGVYRRLLTGNAPERIAREVTRDLESHGGPAGKAAVVARGASAGTPFDELRVGVAQPVYHPCGPVTNLRRAAQDERLFGRETELVGLSEWLAGKGSENHYLGVVGITGTGKTSLVKSVARRHSWRFTEGVIYFSGTDGFSAEQLANALGWDLSDVPQTDLVAEVADRLSRGRYLLVFDDADEYGDASSEAMHDLLDSWEPALGSRAILICHSASADLTPLVGRNWMPVRDLPPTAAVEMLGSLLDGEPGAGNGARIDLAEATRMCFFHPRTISSAAALLGMGQSYRDLRRDLAELDGPLAANAAILKRVVSTLESRAPMTRDMLNCLTVLSTSCRESTWRRLAGEIMPPGADTTRATVRALNELQSARLVERDDNAEDPRCTIHPLVMAHVKVHISVAEPKLRRLVGKHLEIQADIAARDKLYPGGEMASIRRSLQVAAELGMDDPIVRYCAAVIGSSRSPIVRAGPWRFGRELLEFGETAARNTGDSVNLSRFAGVRGKIEYRLTKFDEALAAFCESWDRANESGDSGRQLEALKGQGQVHYRTGRFEAAERVYVQARELASDIGEPAIADVDHQLAKVHYRRKDYQAARIALESALRVREAVDDRSRDVAKSIHELGRVEHACKNFGKAKSLYRKALDIERQNGDAVTEQATLFQLGRLAIDEGSLDEAAGHLASSKALSQRLGDPLWLVHAEYGEALLADAQGSSEARSLAERALADAKALRIGLADEIAVWIAGLDSR